MRELGTFFIQDNPLEDGRIVQLGLQEGGVTVRESLDGEEEGVYLSYQELAHAVYIVLRKEGISIAPLVQQMIAEKVHEGTPITETA